MSARTTSARTAVAALARIAFVVGSGLAFAAGALGDDLRWLGILGLSEAAVVRGLRALGWLAGRPLARAALRLGAPVAAVTVLGARMPSAAPVAWLFGLTGVVRLAWAGLCWRLGGDRVALRAELELWGLVTAVGAWFVSVPLPPSGWSPVAGILLGSGALGARRAPEPAPVEDERP